MMLEMVKLKNGAEEAKPLVVMAMMSLRSLGVTDFVEAVAVARNRDHKPWGNCEESLRRLALFPMHQSIRNVILCAVKGDGLDMTLGSPIAPPLVAEQREKP